jgi:hypothetical protein
MALSGFWWIRRAARHNLPVWCRLCDSRLTLFTRSTSPSAALSLSLAHMQNISSLCDAHPQPRWVFWCARRAARSTSDREWNVNFVVCWCQVTCMKSLAHPRGAPCIIARRALIKWHAQFDPFRTYCFPLRGWVMGRQFVWSLARDTFSRRMSLSYQERQQFWKPHTRWGILTNVCL